MLDILNGSLKFLGFDSKLWTQDVVLPGLLMECRPKAEQANMEEFTFLMPLSVLPWNATLKG